MIVHVFTNYQFYYSEKLIALGQTQLLVSKDYTFYVILYLIWLLSLQVLTVQKVTICHNLWLYH